MTLEEAMAAIKAERDLWQAYQDAQKDAEVMSAMNLRNSTVATDDEVAEHRQIASDLLTRWANSRKEAQASVRDLMAPFGLTVLDLKGAL